MRIYYPVLARELEEGNLAPRPAYCVDPSSSLRGEDLELVEDDARDLAALDSLALLRDEEGALSRCIIAADIEGISVAPYDGEVAQTKAILPPTLSIIPMLQRRFVQSLTHRLKMRLTRLLHSCGMKVWNGTPRKNART